MPINEFTRASIAHLDANLGWGLPKAVLAHLERRRIHGLKALRAAGGVANLSGFPLAHDEPAARLLDAHANLELLTSDANVRTALIRAGYQSILDVARTPVGSFRAAIGDRLSSEGAIALHRLAVAQKQVLDNALVDALMDPSRGTGSEGSTLLAYSMQTVCSCNECQQATSPLAYFVDLLDYALRHLRLNRQSITLTYLQERFRQPFRELPVHCEADQPVRQVRICVEVLRAGLPPQARTATPPGYLEGVYTMLLERIGTSFDELRRVRTASKEDRIALGKRLQLPIDNANRPDPLDDLFRDPSAGATPATAVTESWLGEMFGLRDTTLDPLAAEPPVTLISRRLQYLRAVWRAEDFGPDRPMGEQPAIDPDLIGRADLADATPSMTPRSTRPRTAWRPLDFLEEREAVINDILQDVRATREAVGFEQLLQLGLHGGLGWGNGMDGIVYQDLLDRRIDRDAGIYIGNYLGLTQLAEEEFDFISQIATLDAAQVPILDSEWSELYSFIVGRMKRYQLFAGWRQEEAAVTQGPSAGVVVEPDQFRVRPSDGSADWRATRWRSTEETRARWEALLRARMQQSDAATDSVRSAAAATEEAWLGFLRDALIEMVVRPATVRPDTTARLTRELQIDVAAGICRMITRVGQAIETLQGAVFSVRNGLLDDASLTLDADNFDLEWKWIGSYASWRAAMLIFLYPQIAARPSLLPRQSPGFEAFVHSLRAARPVSAAVAAAAAAEYYRYFADICSLSLVGLGATRSPIGGAADGRDVLAIAAGGVTGRLYASAWKALPGWGFSGSPTQSGWEPIAGIDVPGSLIGRLTFQDATVQPRLAVWLTSKARSHTNDLFYATSYDGARFDTLAQTERLPDVLCSWAASDNQVAPTAAFRAAGGGPWPLRQSDQMVVHDIDGDGRAEVVVMAGQLENDGTRRVAVFRERDGGLLVDHAAALPIALGWTFSGDARPVVSTAGILVVNRTSGGGGQIGMLAWVGSALQLVAPTSQVSGPTGWTVNLGSGADATTFVTVDTGGGIRLVALEQRAGRPPRAYQPRTTLAVMDWSSGGFALVTMQDLIAGGDVRADHPCAIVSRFGPQGSSGDDRQDLVVVLTSLEEHGRTNPVTNVYEVTYVSRYSYALLRWDYTAVQFEVSRTYEQIAPSDPAGPKWSAAPDDTFVPLSERGRPQRIAVNAAGRKLAILAYRSDGQLELAWQTEASVPAAPGSAQAWNPDVRAQIVSADLDGDRRSELVALQPDLGDLAVLGAREGAGLEVRSRIVRTLAGPGTGAEPALGLLGMTTVLIGDLDGDGLDECVFGQLGGTNVAAQLGVGLGIKPPFPHAQLGMASRRMGPLGATVPTAFQFPDNAAQVQAYQQTAATGLTHNLAYLDEAYYFVPQEVALHHAEAGEYEAALAAYRRIYDYTRPLAERRVAQKLVLNGAASPDFTRVVNWLLDPLDPHGIAETRKDAYTRFTLRSLVQCVLAFADAEYTRGTTESVSRAVRLYLQALALLGVPELANDGATCSELIGTLVLQAGTDEEIWIWADIRERLAEFRNPATVANAIMALRPLLDDEGDPRERFTAARRIVDALPAEAPAPATAAALLETEARTDRAVFAAMVADPALDTTLEALARIVNTPEEAQETLYGPPWEHGKPIEYVPALRLWACIPPDPDIAALRRHAELNLQKIRQCRNIAGLAWEPIPELVASDPGVSGLTAGPLEAPARQSFPPVPYRYATLIERAKQLADRAAHFEQAMLSALQSADAARYGELKARQDLELSAASVRLRDVQVTQANDSVGAARLQRARAGLQQAHFNTLLSAGPSENETAAMFLGAIGSGISGGASAGAAAGVGAGAGMGSVVFSTYASHERRAQDWFLALELSQQDNRIGEAQVRVAESQVVSATQERALAELRTRQSAAVVEFMVTKQFGSAALYELMANVNQDVYRSFLQMGTSTALVAQAQLAFERQEPVSSFIRADYWQPLEPAAQDTTGDGALPSDTRGLTGSARLLRDIYELDEHAFRTNQRKLQLSETISLAELDPLAFARFQQTGVLRFVTPMSLFDSKFPGHYLRLVRRVRASIIALIPPVQGIRATLASTGSSRVVVGQDRFQTIRVQRDPEQIAFTSPRDATGVSDLDVSQDMRLPFEGIGIDAGWELRLPRPANLFDYRTMADVLFTIDYSAIESPTYRNDLIRSLARSVTADRPFSFRHQFADAWYDLLNPEQATPPPMTVTFQVRADDFPSNLDGLTVRAVALYFARAQPVLLPSAQLRFTTPGAATLDLGQATPDSDGIISTRRGRWSTVLAPPRSPVGVWELAFPDTPAIRYAFASGSIEDLLFVITFGASTANWPA